MNFKESPHFDLLAIVGPTASGKTSLAASIAAKLGGEVISADSRQVYRRMNLGSGKDYTDYIVEGKMVPYHLIDIVDAGYKYNVFEYQRDFLKVYNDLLSRKVFPVVCGGSGMYIDSIISGYKLFEVPPDPLLRSSLEKKTMEELRVILASFRKLHNITDLDNRKRVIRAIEIEHYISMQNEKKSVFPQLRALITGIMLSRDRRRALISSRLKKRFKEGMIEEVEELLKSGLTPRSLIYYGLEYKYITLYLTGKMSFDEMYKKLEISIHQFAKRQMTWFRGMERRGITIHWIDGDMPNAEKVEKIIQMLKEHPVK